MRNGPKHNALDHFSFQKLNYFKIHKFCLIDATMNPKRCYAVL